MTKSALAASQIRAAVEAWLGPVSDLEPLPEGLVSQVYAFRCDGEAFVARIGPDRAGYEKDAFVARTFARPALPVPEVIAVEPLDDLALCISRRAAGVRLHDTSLADVERLAPALLAVLDEIGRTNVANLTGFGAFDAAGRGACASWRDHLLRFHAGADAWLTRLPSADAAATARALAAIERLAPTSDPPRGLVHGDLGGANLIVDGVQVTGVIDWDRALIGDPAYDAANLCFWNEARLAPVRAALAERHAGDALWRRKVLGYQLRLAVEEIHDVVALDAPVDLPWLLARLRELAPG
ncbi:MAG TPA: aminoglycoside phosphotransferase family protein [Caulobacteraceae bacterium]|nr:aminoglycoside phosphotransferase family protein [Caulobacteraceae bacterium]